LYKVLLPSEWIRGAQEHGGMKAYVAKLYPPRKPLRPSDRTRELWSAVRKARRKSTLFRRAQAWLESLAEDVTKQRTEDTIQHRMKHGITYERDIQKGGYKRTAPRLVEVPDSECFETKGSYVGPFPVVQKTVARYCPRDRCIEIATRNHTLKEIRETLLHETLHWLRLMDAVGDPDELHASTRWRERLRELEETFPP